MAFFAKAKKFEVIINFPNEEKASRELDRETLKRLALLGKFYTILHDAFSASEKEDETIHRHLVIVANEENSSNGWLLAIRTIFGYPANCFTIMSIKNVRTRVRYLTHVDDSEKYQFDLDRVQTNDTRGLKAFMEETKSVDMDTIISYNGDFVSFGRDFGATMAIKYRTLIKDTADYSFTSRINERKVATAELIISHYKKFGEDIQSAIDILSSVLKGVHADDPLWTCLGYLERVQKNDFIKFPEYAEYLTNLDGEIK